MAYCVSNMIGIRTGGVFSGETDLNDLKKLIIKVIKEMQDSPFSPNIDNDLSNCMSQELTAGKGSYVVIAGVFNYWTFDRSSEFSRRLSKELGCEIMHMCWDEEDDSVQCQIFLDGQPLFETVENPIGKIIRRVS